MNGIEKICSVMGCDELGGLRQGMCIKHYTRFMRHGDPLINYIRKQRRENVVSNDIIKADSSHYLSLNERESLRDILSDKMDIHERENIY